MIECSSARSHQLSQAYHASHNTISPTHAPRYVKDLQDCNKTLSSSRVYFSPLYLKRIISPHHSQAHLPFTRGGMGKSGARRKKSANTADQSSTTPVSIPSSTLLSNGVGSDASVCLKSAYALKEEGNLRFQAKEYSGALDKYELALRLLPHGHPERAVFHSNRAACLLQMRPVDHEAVAAECSLALQAQPRYCRALLRRARALEALRRYDLALQDINSLLSLEPSHPDALELAGRLRSSLSTSSAHHPEKSMASRPSPAALGASALCAAAPINGLGACLPSRPASKRPCTPPPLPKLAAEKENLLLASLPTSHLKLESTYPALPNLPVKAFCDNFFSSGAFTKAAPAIRMRPLKLVYDNDIRLSEMPVNCSFKTLREIVAKRYPSSKSVLMKYRDLDGDLITVTSTRELRLAESCTDETCHKKRHEGNVVVTEEKLQMLRLHIVEVSPEQEPLVVDDNTERDMFVKGDGNLLPSLIEDLPEINTSVELVVKEKDWKEECDHTECKEVDIDDWLYDFAQLFRQQVGIDPDSHLDLHELGMELCSEALEETITSKEAQELFDMAAAKFQEVAALAFFNWGNVHMCAARKRISFDDSLQKEAMETQLQEAYDWVKRRYVLAGQKYEKALQTKPDFYEGLLALGQQHFETAKLHWSFALANNVDIKKWDSSETMELFDSAEEKMKAATMVWEKAEELTEPKDASLTKKDELLKQRKKQGILMDGQRELSAEEVEEHATVMRSQIHLFWGNLLFERSQVEFKLGFVDWKKSLDGAIERFKLAGASETDIFIVLNNHSSRGGSVDENKSASRASSDENKSACRAIGDENKSACRASGDENKSACRASGDENKSACRASGDENKSACRASGDENKSTSRASGDENKSAGLNDNN